MLEKLTKLIDNSSLSDQDKELWKKQAASADDVFIESLIYFFEEMPDKVDWLNQNLKTKIEIMKSGDEEKWNQFLIKEKEEVAQMLAQ